MKKVSNADVTPLIAFVPPGATFKLTPDLDPDSPESKWLAAQKAAYAIILAGAPPDQIERVRKAMNDLDEETIAFIHDRESVPVEEYVDVAKTALAFARQLAMFLKRLGWL